MVYTCIHHIEGYLLSRRQLIEYWENIPSLLMDATEKKEWEDLPTFEEFKKACLDYEPELEMLDYDVRGDPERGIPPHSPSGRAIVYMYLIKNELFTKEVIESSFEKWIDGNLYNDYYIHPKEYDYDRYAPIQPNDGFLWERTVVNRKLRYIKRVDDSGNPIKRYTLEDYESGRSPSKFEIEDNISETLYDHFNYNDKFEFCCDVEEVLLYRNMSINGMELYTWPCCSPLNGIKYILGRCLKSPPAYNIEEIFTTVCTDETSDENTSKDSKKKLEPLPKCPLEGDFEVKTYLMLNDCTSCS